MKQYEIVTATFKPRRTDDLQNDATQWIGRTLQWQSAWIIEDGPYAGEWAMTPHDVQSREKPGFAWVPSGDLEIAK